MMNNQGTIDLRNGWHSIASERHIIELLVLGGQIIGRIDPAEDHSGFVGGYLGQGGYSQFTASNLLEARGEVQRHASGCIGAHCTDLATLLESVKSGACIYAGSQLSVLKELDGLFDLRPSLLEHSVRDPMTGCPIVIEPYDVEVASA